MRFFLIGLLAGCALLMALNLSGQQKTKKPAKVLRPTVFLGRDRFCGGVLAKSVFDKMLSAQLSARDSVGNVYQVVGFDVNYAERRLYEDPDGNLVVMTDYTGDHCFGDTLSAGISAFLAEHSKSGDTAFFDNVLLVRVNKKSGQPQPDSTAFLGKGIKVILTK